MQRGLLLIDRSGGVLNGDAEHLTKVLTESVGCTTLDTTASGGDVAFNSGGVVAAGELLLLGLLTLNDGHGKELLVNLGIVVKDAQNFLTGSTFS